MVSPEQKKRMPGKHSLKKAVKWIFCDRVVVFFAVVGVILLLVTLIFFARRVDLIKYRGIEYGIGGTSYCHLLLKMTTPALAVNILLRGLNVGTTLQYIIQYFLMFAAQIIAYGVVGKIASVMSSNWIVAVCIYTAIILFVFALAYLPLRLSTQVEAAGEIDPAQESVLETVTSKPFYLLLMTSNLPALYAGQYLLGVFGKTALSYLIFFPFMFIIQVLLYGFLGKLISSMLGYV